MRNKEWGAGNFGSTARMLAPDFKTVQLGSPSDPALPVDADLRGRTSLREAAAVLANSAAFVGLEGFLSHLARAVDCPAVVVFGGRARPEDSATLSIPTCTRPWNARRAACATRAVYERICLSRITPAAVCRGRPCPGRAPAGRHPPGNRRAVTTPDLSVIIPVFNRGPVIRYTLESVRRASAGLAVETIVVDDGSEPPVARVLEQLGFAPTRLLRQPNQGLLYARLAGLKQAIGRHVQFLDSDDIVSADKFRLQLAALAATGADICYTDAAHCVLAGDFDSLLPVADPPFADTADATEFGIRIQPPPHSPIFRAAWINHVVGGGVHRAVTALQLLRRDLVLPERRPAWRKRLPRSRASRNHWGPPRAPPHSQLGDDRRGLPRHMGGVCARQRCGTPVAMRARQLLAGPSFLHGEDCPRVPEYVPVWSAFGAGWSGGAEPRSSAGAPFGPSRAAWARWAPSAIVPVAGAAVRHVPDDERLRLRESPKHVPPPWNVSRACGSGRSRSHARLGICPLAWLARSRREGAR